MQRILSKREKRILYATIAIIIFGVSFNLVNATVLRKNDVLNKETAVTKVKLRKYSWLLSHKDALQNKYNKFTSGVDLSEDKRGRKDTLVATLSELESMAKASNIRIIDLRPQGQKEEVSVGETLIDLRTEGSIEDYLKFIYDIENSPSLLRIKRFQLNARPNTQDLEGSFSILRTTLF